MQIPERRRRSPLPDHVGFGESVGSRLRRRVYLGALLIGTPVMVVVWLLNLRQSPPDAFMLYVYPPLLLVYGWTGAWLSRRGSVRLAERVVFVTQGLFLLAQLVASLAAAPGTLMDITSSTYWTLVALAIIAFLIFDARTGVIATAVLYVVSVALPWLSLLLVPSVDTQRWPDLLRVQLTCGAILTLLYGLAWYRERFAQEQAAREHLEVLAFRDPLTGCANRHRLYDVISLLLVEARVERAFAVVLFDLDHFKRLNDTYGHAAGDAALVETARRASHVLREQDVLGRWGGEEFLVVLPDADGAGALLVAERLRVALASRGFPHGAGVTGSFGVAAWAPGDSLESIVARADAGLYEAKATGRNAVGSVATPTLA